MRPFAPSSTLPTDRVASLLRRTSVDPARVFAFERTGLLLTPENETLADPYTASWWSAEAELFAVVSSGQGPDLVFTFAGYAAEVLAACDAATPVSPLTRQWLDVLSPAETRILAEVLEGTVPWVFDAADPATLRRALHRAFSSAESPFGARWLGAWADGKVSATLPSTRLEVVVAFLAAVSGVGLPLEDVASRMGSTLESSLLALASEVVAAESADCGV